MFKSRAKKDESVNVKTRQSILNASEQAKKLVEDHKAKAKLQEDEVKTEVASIYRQALEKTASQCQALKKSKRPKKHTWLASLSIAARVKLVR